MANLNLAQLIPMLRQGNPKAIAQQIIQSNFSNDPNMMNLLRMGEQGDIQGLEQIAKQMLNLQGKDYNTEMQNLMKMIK